MEEPDLNLIDLGKLVTKFARKLCQSDGEIEKTDFEGYETGLYNPKEFFLYLLSSIERKQKGRVELHQPYEAEGSSLFVGGEFKRRIAIVDVESGYASAGNAIAVYEKATLKTSHELLLNNEIEKLPILKIKFTRKIALNGSGLVGEPSEEREDYVKKAGIWVPARLAGEDLSQAVQSEWFKRDTIDRKLRLPQDFKLYLMLP